jgi:hypothetical protein
MQKIMIALLLVISTGTMAQNKTELAERNLIITPINQAEKSTRKNTVLNVSDFIPIRKGELIKLQPNLTSLPRQHQFLKGVLKSAAVFALTYKASKVVSNTIKGSNANAQTTNLAPSLGFGLASGLPDMLQGLKNKKSYLIYTIYDANKKPIAIQKILLKKQYNSYIFDKATSDGFLKAIILGNSKRMVSGNLNIVIAKETFKGQIANNFELNSYGDCSGEGGAPICACLSGCNLTWSNCTDGPDAALVLSLLACNILPLPAATVCMYNANQAHTKAIEKCDATNDACVAYCKNAYPSCN